MSELLITKVGTSSISHNGELCITSATDIVRGIRSFERRQGEDDETANSILVSSGALLLVARKLGLTVEQLSAMDAQTRYQTLAINAGEKEHEQLAHHWEYYGGLRDARSNYVLLEHQYSQMSETERWATAERLKQNIGNGVTSVVNFDDRKGLLTNLSSRVDLVRNHDNDDTTLSVVKLGLAGGLIRRRDHGEVSGNRRRKQKRAIVVFLTDVAGVRVDALREDSEIYSELSASDAVQFADEIDRTKGLKQSNGGMGSKLRNAAEIASMIDGEVFISSGQSDYDWDYNFRLLRTIDGEVGTRITA